MSKVLDIRMQPPRHNSRSLTVHRYSRASLSVKAELLGKEIEYIIHIKLKVMIGLLYSTDTFPVSLSHPLNQQL